MQPYLSSEGYRALLCLDRRSWRFPHPDSGLTTQLHHLSESQNSDYLFAEAVFSLRQLVEKHGRVLVHCRAGVHRSVCVVAGYLCVAEGWSSQDAMQFVATRRGSPQPNPSLTSLVMRMQEIWDENLEALME